MIFLSDDKQADIIDAFLHYIQIFGQYFKY